MKPLKKDDFPPRTANLVNFTGTVICVAAAAVESLATAIHSGTQR